MMSEFMLELRQDRRQSADDVLGLQACLASLVGEPFRFARISYGDELTLHFGDLRPARSPKLHGHFSGVYILGVRGSAWIVKSGSESLAVAAGVFPDSVAADLGKPLSKQDFEKNPIIQAESRVVEAIPFPVKPVNGFGLQLRFSDGSTLLILPTPPEEDDPEDEGLPELADWELLSPHGLLSAGPGLQWSFQPSAGDGSAV
jgi:hypothetical protein